MRAGFLGYKEGLGVLVEFWIFWFCLRETENTYRFRFLFFIFYFFNRWCS